MSLLFTLCGRDVMVDPHYATTTWLVWFSVTFGQPSFSFSVSSISTIMAEVHQVRQARSLSRWNRELTLKCKLKCYVKPMKDPLGVSPSKGNQGTTRDKEKNLLTSVGDGRVTVDLIRRSWVRSPPRSKYFFFASCGSLIPFTRTNAQWVFHGLHIAL